MNVWEFLGDAVLEVVSSEFLYKNFPKLPEGQSTKKGAFAGILCETARTGQLSALEKERKRPEGETGIPSFPMRWRRPIGAIFLDGGFTNAKEFILNYVLNDIEHKQLFYDSKDYPPGNHTGSDGGGNVLRSAQGEGPDHDKNFCVAVRSETRSSALEAGEQKKRRNRRRRIM